MLKFHHAAILTAGLAGAFVSAQAATVTLATYQFATPPGTTLGIDTVTLVGGPTGNLVTNAGAFLGSVTGAPGFNTNSLYTFCVELGQNIAGFAVSANNYTPVDPSIPGYNVGPPNGWGSNAAGISARLDQLLAYVLGGGSGGVTNATDASALQLAVWETIYDFGSNSLTAGSFTATSAFGAVPKANIFLSASLFYLGPVTHYWVMTNPDLQDVLVPVSEPGTIALAGIALLGLARSRRRCS